MRQPFRWKQDLVHWHRDADGHYWRNDGLATCTRWASGAWTCAIRPGVEADWQESPYSWGALHAAQSECRRMHQRLATTQAREREAP
jgi:hypothetical protein